MKKRITSSFFIPAGVVILFAVLSLTGILTSFENKIFDAFLIFRKSPPENPSVVLVDIEDETISAVGTWPISRHITADGLMLLRELGAEYAVFDIDYIDKSPNGVNAEVLSSEIPETMTNEFESLKYQTRELFTAISEGRIPIREAKGYINDLIGLADQSKEKVSEEIGKISRDNDEYLGNASRFFGKAFFTVYLLDSKDEKITEELRKFGVDRFALKKITTDRDRIMEKVDFHPAIIPIAGKSQGLGFPNVPIDSDGVRRKIDLLAKSGGAYFPQLVLGPVLRLLGDPELHVTADEIVIKDAEVPGQGRKTIRIPIAQDGKVYIDWPHKSYVDSFKHLLFIQLYAHKQLYDTLVYDLKIRDSWGYMNNYTGGMPLLELNRMAEELRTAIMEGREDPTKVEEFRALRNAFIEETGKFLATSPEKAIVEMVNSELANPKLNKDTRTGLETILKDAPEYFTQVKAVHKQLVETREGIKSKAQGAFCVIGNTGTGTTDIGVNPFEKRYMNVGTHASVANMILNGSFIDDLSPYWSLLIAVALAFGLSLLVKRLSPLVGILTGIGVSVAIVAVLALAFALTGTYIQVLPVVGTVFLSFIGVTFVQFLKTSKEKGFIRNAFSHYLSGDVIKQIMANPDLLQLGGTEKLMTAMFTDIRGFSTVSEKLTAGDLVRLLNEYLTAMSDIILDLNGTIDKYEGDAIIAFFGAPLDLHDHAERALIASMKMKRVERELNEKFLANNASPTPLLTRIGINTGNMVVGNMGTTKKMDYTIIGDAVNLAARLEGVNKQYGTWVCVSEDTFQAGGSVIEARKLDRIRVVGKQVPIRIYEILEEKGKLGKKMSDLLPVFGDAMDLFERKEWKESSNRFDEALAIFPEDPPSQRYSKLSKEYMANPPPANWDGVFSLTMK